MWIVYQVVAMLAMILAAPFLLIRRGRHYLGTIPGRMASYDGVVPQSPHWLHAVSVGEVGVANTLIGAMPPEQPLLVTTITPTGQERAQALLGERAAIAYLPYETDLAIQPFLRRFAPRSLILVEGDLWPLLLERVKRRRVPIAVVNGRISDDSFRRMRRLRPLLGPLLDRVDGFAVQTDEDRRRLIELGVPADRVHRTGNLKFETPEIEPQPEVESKLDELAAGRPILIAGSTMRGEENQVLDSFALIGGGDRALLVLAPRHPERWDEVAELVEKEGLDVLRRSQWDSGHRPDVLLLDSLGELAALYRAGFAAFIGGTLVPTGGHNPLESARFGVPTVVGPSMQNFREIAEIFDRAAAWERAADAAQLARVWERWLDDPAAAQEIGRRGADVVTDNRGALKNTLDFLLPLLEIGGPAKD
jgi:3-deoxy-D-manno-octulosonic-acid transferase